MADKTDVLLAFWQEQRESDRQVENQRATLTNIIVVIVSAGLGFLAQKGLHPPMLTVTVTMVALGIYGAMASLKSHERCAFHMRQARWLRQKIGVLHPELEFEDGLAAVRSTHRLRFPLLVRTRMYALWVALHSAIALSGAILSVWILAV
ncbi:hypothetical protein GCM10009837_19980 [Streptomyces durmitorensis]|uniref:Uncharacterized protein n=1 Tax=Streptomyces durmitorensis TaxID=319947 RepID=A0ABY4PNF6_9ACTN|nr:hypothetical protein [Streptomyces durmitorensis]UQT55343.1 hypothetical protein M4V62_09665 [Streptomyces durmitorensis]